MVDRINPNGSMLRVDRCSDGVRVLVYYDRDNDQVVQGFAMNDDTTRWMIDALSKELAKRNAGNN